MTSLEFLQEIDAWLSFNNSPSKEQISELRNDIKKHISQQLNILHINKPLSCDGCKYHNTPNDDFCGTCGDTYKNKAP